MPQEVMQGLGIQVKGISRTLSIKPIIARYKKSLVLDKDTQGWYWFLGKKYKETEQIPDEELFEAAYKSLSLKEQKLFRWYKITLEDETTDFEGLIEQLKTHQGIEQAQPNHIHIYHAFPEDPPNDHYYSAWGSWGQDYPDLWGVHSINIEEAWRISLGQGVVVAVIDSGVDYNHSDIFDNIWVNPGEVSDRNEDGKIDLHDIDLNGDNYISQEELQASSDNEDNDENGLSDDLFGWDYGMSRDRNDDGDFDDPEDNRDNDPMDEEGHGTHVAGIIAACGNNEEGIIGVAPRAKIMALKAGPFMFDEFIVRCWYYAAEQGARVFNNSWGTELPEPSNPILEDAIEYVVKEHNVIAIFSAGNRHSLVSSYSPANHPLTLAVGATNHEDRRSTFSNYGEGLDVVAPGGDEGDLDTERHPFLNVLSLRAEDTDMYCLNPDAIDRLPQVCDELIVDQRYYRARGTSMSAAFVSGLAALLKTQFPEDDPTDIMWRLRLGSDDLGEQGPDPGYGFGRINCYNSLTRPASAHFNLISHQFYETEGNGDGLIQVGEGGSLVFTVRNEWRDAHSTMASLTTDNPHVEMIRSSVFLGDVTSGQERDNTSEPFIFRIRDDFPLYLTLRMTLRIEADSFSWEFPMEVVVPMVEGVHTPINPYGGKSFGDNISGRVYAAWWEYDEAGRRDVIYFSCSQDFGKTWEEPRELWSEVVRQNPRRPLALLDDDSGNVYIAWFATVSDQTKIYLLSSPDQGESWLEAPIEVNQISQPFLGGDFYFSWAIDNEGGVYFVWREVQRLSQFSVRWTLRYSYSPDRGINWTLREKNVRQITYDDVSPGSSGQGPKPLVAEGGRGNVYLLWERQGIDLWHRNLCFTKSSDYGDNWEEENIILNSTSQPFFSLPEFSYSLLCDHSGHVYVVWIDSHGNTDIYFNRSEDFGRTWLREEIRLDIGEPHTGRSTDFYFTVDEQGHLYLAWVEDEHKVYFRTSCDYGNGWQDPIVVMQDDSFERYPGHLKIDFNSSGLVGLSWTMRSSPYEQFMVDVYFTYFYDYGSIWQGEYVKVSPYHMSGLVSGPEWLGCNEGGYFSLIFSGRGSVFSSILSLPVPFMRGDVNRDGRADISDAVCILTYLFCNGRRPLVWDAADANDDGGITVADAVYLLQFLFARGPLPPQPFPDKGFDPTPDFLW